jgi:hypothetical protein
MIIGKSKTTALVVIGSSTIEPFTFHSQVRHFALVDATFGG